MLDKNLNLKWPTSWTVWHCRLKSFSRITCTSSLAWARLSARSEMKINHYAQARKKTQQNGEEWSSRKKDKITKNLGSWISKKKKKKKKKKYLIFFKKKKKKKTRLFYYLNCWDCTSRAWNKWKMLSKFMFTLPCSQRSISHLLYY